MIGKLISKAIKIATLPVDAVEIGLDLLSGGDGSREATPFPKPSKLRDKLADTAADIDKEKS